MKKSRFINVEKDPSFSKISKRHVYSFRNRFEQENSEAIKEAKKEQAEIKRKKYQEFLNNKKDDAVIKKQPTPEGTHCPSCEGMLIMRKGKFGIFLGCSNYPECKETGKATKSDKRKFQNKKTKRGKNKPVWVRKRQQEKDSAMKEYKKHAQERWRQYQEFQRKIAD